MSRLQLLGMRNAIRRCFALLFVLGAVALIVTQQRLQARLDSFDCPAQPGQSGAVSKPTALSSLTWELAGHAQGVLQQLRPEPGSSVAEKPGVQTLVCVQARIKFLQAGYNVLDKPLFMPLYGLLSLLLALWVLGQGGRAARLAAGTLLLATAGLLGLDALENTQALNLLQVAEGELLSAPNMAALEAGAQATRAASVAKWGASGVWAATLAWALWCWHPASARKWVRWLRMAIIALLGLSAVAFAASALWGWRSDAIDGPMGLVAAGMVMSLTAMALVAVVLWFGVAGAPDSADGGLPPELKKQAGAARQDSLEGHLARDFHMEEYRQIRAEVTGLLARVETLFRASIVAAATVFALVASNGMGLEAMGVCLKLPHAFVAIGWLLPPVLVLCTGLAALVSHLRVNEISGYLLQLEQALGGRSLGWEAYLKLQPTRLTPMVAGLWGLLFTLAVIVSIVGLLAVEQAVGSCTAKPDQQGGSSLPVAPSERGSVAQTKPTAAAPRLNSSGSASLADIEDVGGGTRPASARSSDQIVSDSCHSARARCWA